MYNYAQLNADNVCIGISTLSSEVTNENLVPIDEFDLDFLYRKFENNEWSADKFQSEATPIKDEVADLKAKVRYLEEVQQEQEAALIEIAEMTLGGME